MLLWERLVLAVRSPELVLARMVQQVEVLLSGLAGLELLILLVRVELVVAGRLGQHI